jgi:GAF domain-containing protein
MLAAAFGLLNADRGAIVLLEAATGGHPVHFACKKDGSELPLSLSTSLAEEVLTTRTAMISHDVAHDPLLQRAVSLCGEGVRSTMCVPLLHAGELLGVIQLDSLSEINVFTEKDLGLFLSVASQAALALKKGLLDDRVQTTRFEDRLRVERLIRVLPAAIVLLEANGRILAVNDRARRLLGPFAMVEPGDSLLLVGGLGLHELLSSEGAPRELVAEGPPRSAITVTARRAHERGDIVLIVDEVRERS